ENMRIADLLHAANRLFGFEPIDHGLDGGVRGLVLGRESLLNLSNRGRTSVPECLHDLQLESGQLGQGHLDSPTSVSISTTDVGDSQIVCRTNVVEVSACRARHACG